MVKKVSLNAKPPKTKRSSKLSPKRLWAWIFYKWRYWTKPTLVAPQLLSEQVSQRSQLVLHRLGYGLLVFALFDYLQILIPPQFTDPVWEFQTLGSLVEHIVVPLIGFAFVFYRQPGLVDKREMLLLRSLSWSALLLGIFYLAMLPLGIVNTWRLDQRNHAQILAQVSQQSQSLQQVKQKLDQATSDEQITSLLTSLNPPGRTPPIANPQAVRQNLLTQLSQTEQTWQNQAQTTLKSQRQALIKNSLKWNLGAIVSAMLLIWVWRLTRWTRSG